VLIIFYRLTGGIFWLKRRGHYTQKEIRAQFTRPANKPESVEQAPQSRIIREMTAPEGGFYSTQDADSEGKEGKFFLWTPEEIREVLGEQADLFMSVYGVTERGNFPGSRAPHHDYQCMTGYWTGDYWLAVTLTSTRLRRGPSNSARYRCSDKVSGWVTPL
jgi:hypothetical protein